MKKDLLVVDDDFPFRERLSRSMEKKVLMLNHIHRLTKQLKELMKKNLIMQL